MMISEKGWGPCGIGSSGGEHSAMKNVVIREKIKDRMGGGRRLAATRLKRGGRSGP